VVGRPLPLPTGRNPSFRFLPAARLLFSPSVPEISLLILSSAPKLSPHSPVMNPPQYAFPNTVRIESFLLFCYVLTRICTVYGSYTSLEVGIIPSLSKHQSFLPYLNTVLFSLRQVTSIISRKSSSLKLIPLLFLLEDSLLPSAFGMTYLRKARLSRPGTIRCLTKPSKLPTEDNSTWDVAHLSTSSVGAHPHREVTYISGSSSPLLLPFMNLLFRMFSSHSQRKSFPYLSLGDSVVYATYIQC